MRTVTISHETMIMIRQQARLPFKQTATRQHDGTWLLHLSDEVYEKLESVQLDNESIDDAIQRALRALSGMMDN